MRAQNIDSGAASEKELGGSFTGPARAAGEWSYGRQLRALGQAVEKFGFTALDLEQQEGSYAVIGRALPGAKARPSLSRWVGELIAPRERPAKKAPEDAQVTLTFSPEDIERFDRIGRSRRLDGGQLPNPHSLSQVLRGAGTLLDRKQVADLIGISLSEGWMAISFQTASGEVNHIKENLQCYYDLWVKLYLHRSNRPKEPPPSEPTFKVFWRDFMRT